MKTLPAAIACALGFLCFAAAAHAQNQAEKYQYQVTWGSAKVAKMTLQRGCDRNGYVPAMLTATSRGFAEQIHDLNIRLDSFARADDRPMEGRTFIDEEGVTRRFQTRFGSQGKSVVKKSFRNKETVLELKFRGTTHDLISWWFALRKEAKLTPGSTFNYHVWDGWKLVRLTAKVIDKRRLWTPAGTHDALQVKLERTRLHHKGPQAYQPRAAVEKLGVIWLAADRARTPIGMDLDAPVGVAKVRLIRAAVAACEKGSN